MFDLVVVGGGPAGWVGARRSQELGARVLLVDKGDEAPGWGNGRVSAGVVHVAKYDPMRGPKELEARIRKTTGGCARPELVTAMAHNCGRAVRWLAQQGVSFVKSGPEGSLTWTLAPARPRVPGVVWQGFGADRMLKHLHRLVLAGGGACRMQTRAVALASEGGSVTGVVIENRGGRLTTVSAPAILLADGGFQADDELLRRYVGAGKSQIKLRGIETGTGDGLRMALDMGALVANMQYLYGHCLCRDALTNDQLWPYPWLDEIIKASLLVTSAGRRAGDEGVGGVGMANAIVRSGDPLGCWAIFDQAVWEGPGRGGFVPANPLIPKLGGTVVSADSLNELATRTGIDVAALTETVAAHNRYCREGAPLVPARTGKAHALEHMPWYAIPAVAGITDTCGGLLVNANAQVLGPGQLPIPGLYAAGTAMGGLQGAPQGGYVGGLSQAITFGVLAAEHIVKRTMAPLSVDSGEDENVAT